MDGMRQARARWVAIAATAVCAALGPALCGCSPAAPRLPAGISIDVYQSRFDYGEHKLEVSIRNSTDRPFEVRSLEFSSPSFASATTYERTPSTVRANTTTDFRLLLPATDCRAAAGAPLVRLAYSFGGEVATISTVPKDRLGQLPRIRAEDCREDEVHRVATITPTSPIEYATIDGKRVARIEFTVTPTGAGGTLVIEDVRGTVLLGLVDENTGSTTDVVPLGLDVGASRSPLAFTLVVAPARCDAHATAEDKRGTFFPFTVRTRQGEGRLYIGLNDAQRTELYAFVRAACAAA